MSRPPVLAPGDVIDLGGSTYTVTSLSGGAVGLRGVAGELLTIQSSRLFADPGFTVVTPRRSRVPLPCRGDLDGLPADVAAKAEWWEGHILEVLTGIFPGGRPDTTPKPQYDPLRTSLRQREIAKVAELRAAGETASLAGVGRMRRRYLSGGLLGLVDGRVANGADSSVDPRLAAALEQAVEGETNRSTGTVTRLRRRVEQILTVEHGIDPAVVMPSRATFYRLVKRAAVGRHTFGSAPTRRSLAQRPGGPFGAVPVLRPGEWMPIDSTPLDVRVVLDDGTVDRADLTMIVDIATRTIPAAVLRPTTKAVDASLLLARCLTPEPMRPGWVGALRMSRSVLPHERLVAIDPRLENAAARPVIVPETLVCDHGMVYLSQAFRAACRAMGVNFQPTHQGSPWEKGTVERTFSSIATLFAQHVAGYVGRSVDRRGKDADGEASFSLVELQDLLDEWIVACWQNRPHDGLRHPLTPGKALSPNEQYAALVEVAGYVPVPLGAEDYIELLPAAWRVINAYGIKINHRTYDSRELNAYRRQHSGVNAKNGRWEIHYDPYDVTRIWVRNHIDGGWMTAVWTHLKLAPTPFGEQAWSAAQHVLARRGGDTTDLAEIAGAVSALLDRAEQGPAEAAGTTLTSRDKRVAARTRATTEPAWPRPADAEATSEASDAGSPGGEDAAEAETTDSVDAAETGASPSGIAPVIPLGVFDAEQEAKRWW